MAGMLPGVECARRRRFHQSRDAPSASAHGWTRRPSFCLYRSNHEIHQHTTIPAQLKQRSLLNRPCQDERLGGVAREAKERLDERLRTQGKSDSKRGRSLKIVEGRLIETGELQTEVFGAKRSGFKRFNWAKLSWKAYDQDECTICLDQFRSGETLVHLPCAHRFHSRCLVPWLENNALCPCCRLEVHIELS